MTAIIQSSHDDVPGVTGRAPWGPRKRGLGFPGVKTPCFLREPIKTAPPEGDGCPDGDGLALTTAWAGHAARSKTPAAPPSAKIIVVADASTRPRVIPAIAGPGSFGGR